MTKLSEYLALIPKGLPKSVQIVKAIINNVRLKYDSLPEDERNEIVKRRIICTNCPYMSQNAKTSKEYFSLKSRNYESKRKEDHCSFCGCGVETRTASLDSNCGIDVYNKENPQNSLTLKWFKYGKEVDSKEG